MSKNKKQIIEGYVSLDGGSWYSPLYVTDEPNDPLHRGTYLAQVLGDLFEIDHDKFHDDTLGKVRITLEILEENEDE